MTPLFCFSERSFFVGYHSPSCNRLFFNIMSTCQTSTSGGRVLAVVRTGGGWDAMRFWGLCLVSSGLTLHTALTFYHARRQHRHNRAIERAMTIAVDRGSRGMQSTTDPQDPPVVRNPSARQLREMVHASPQKALFVKLKATLWSPQPLQSPTKELQCLAWATITYTHFDQRAGTFCEYNADQMQWT